jgi:uncharacterized protein YkwD
MDLRGRWLVLAAAATLLLAALAACSTQGAAGPSSSTGNDLATLEQQILAAVNVYRASHGLRALTWSDVIADQARQHSASMAGGAAAFGHEGFNDRVAVIGQTIPWSDAAEIVAVTANQSTAAMVVNAWLDSPEHRSYIEGDFDVTGVGVARLPGAFLYSTQILIKSR